MSGTATKKKTGSAKKSGNPARRAAAKKASSVSDFKKQGGGKLVTLPSGLGMTVRRVSLQTFIEQGDVPNPLLPIVQEALNKGQDVDMSEIIGDDPDLEKIADMYEMMGAVVCQTAVQPNVHPVPDDEDDRDGDLLYVDEIEDEDRMFLFQLALGGTDDVVRFRHELESDLGSLAEGTSRPRTPKSTSRARKR